MEQQGNKRGLFGIILIVVGVFLILDRLNLIPWNIADILISWQMLIVAVGVISLVSGNRVGGSILIALGAFFMLPELVSIPREIRRIYWPLILVVVGVVILMKQRSRTPMEIPDNLSMADRNDIFDDFVLFGGREIFISSQNLKGGKSTALFGGIEYDMRKAELSPAGAVVDCATIFGGCTFKMPPDWTVHNEVTTIFGAFTDKRGDAFQFTQANPAKTIVIKGLSLFGGIEVKLI